MKLFIAIDFLSSRHSVLDFFYKTFSEYRGPLRKVIFGRVKLGMVLLLERSPRGVTDGWLEWLNGLVTDMAWVVAGLYGIEDLGTVLLLLRSRRDGW